MQRTQGIQHPDGRSRNFRPREEQPYEPGRIISPANPALVPSPQAGAQDPGNTAVQEPKDEKVTIGPANPDNSGPSDKT